MNDLRFALRQLRKNPGFTALAVVSLALGIGLNSTVFSALDAAFLRPMTFQDPDTIIRIEAPAFSYPDYADLRGQCQTLAGVVAVSRHAAILRRQEDSETLPNEVVSPNYFSVLRVGAAVGRVFSENDPQLRSEPLVVLSYGLWRSRFGGDPAIVGRSLMLNGQSYSVLGVAQKGYCGVNRFPKAELWLCAERDPTLQQLRTYRDFALLGRRAPTASAAQVQSEVEGIVGRLGLKDAATGRPERVLVFSEAESTMDHGGKLAILVMGCVGLVLLVACANVSSMLLARNEERQREIAVRLALGASRWRLLQQLLVEGLWLAVLGAGVGLLLTTWARGGLLALVPANFLQFAPELRVDHRVFGLTVALAFLTTLASGLAPAWRAGRVDCATVLKGGTTPLGRGWRRLGGRNALVVGQLAVSVVFLVTAGLLVRGFLRGLALDLGFEKKDMLQVLIAPEMGGAEAQPYFSQLMDRVAALPGVKQASVALRAPLSLSGGGATQKVFLPGDDASGNAEGRVVGFNIVEANFFKTLGVRLAQGRFFDPRDDASSARVAIISEAMARRYWPGQDPLGQSIRVGSPQSPPTEIVGIARDVVRNQIGEVAEPFIYLPFRQHTWGEMTLLVETRGDPGAVLGLVRQEMRRLNASIVPVFVDTQKQLIRTALFPQWATAWLLGGLGSLAFALAVAGLYGVISYSVAQRTREIGIRTALGARPADTVRLILRQGVSLALIGVGIGLPVAFALGRVLQALLLGLSPADPATFLGASLLVIGVAALAGYLPARRAAKVDPMVALRAE